MTKRDRVEHFSSRIDQTGHAMHAFTRALCIAASIVVALMTCRASAREPVRIDDPAPAMCKVPDETSFFDAPLPRLARRLKSSEPLTIVVMGSGSAAGSGTSGKDAAFPQRLEARFRQAFGKTKTRLHVFAEPGQTASGMYERLGRDVLPLRPALVIWQTGSADATRGVQPMEFAATLERGITSLHARGSEVVLIDSQFSPRASLLVNTDAYRDAVRLSARRNDVPLFRRYDTMQYWWSKERFDLDTESKTDQVINADHIHDCVAALLVRLIERGVRSATTKP